LVLAARLGIPLYRLDLSSVVSKYISKQNATCIGCSPPPGLDVLLLLDGATLLARRTSVGNAHDRYANLETNFLLQRLESHRGLVLVTTNALDRIDHAFLRRFDVLLNFRLPESDERLDLWRAHLPADHRVTAATLARVAESCALSGGQIRNVVLAAASLALALAAQSCDRLLSTHCAASTGAAATLPAGALSMAMLALRAPRNGSPTPRPTRASSSPADQGWRGGSSTYRPRKGTRPSRSARRRPTSAGRGQGQGRRPG
jgi:SpoVK/Ycf46/Vps4 family AAA+-type ATPase